VGPKFLCFDVDYLPPAVLPENFRLKARLNRFEMAGADPRPPLRPTMCSRGGPRQIAKGDPIFILDTAISLTFPEFRLVYMSRAPPRPYLRISHTFESVLDINGYNRQIDRVPTAIMRSPHRKRAL
jgi:hypothetical protein